MSRIRQNYREETEALVNQQINIQLTATQVDALTFRNGRYVIELTGAPEVTLLYGKFQVKRLKY